MTSVAQQEAPPDKGQRHRRKRHRWRWIIAALTLLVAVIVLAIGLFIELQSTPAPLRLPTTASKAPLGPVDGIWGVAAGSVAGFRVQESFIGFTNDVVGRTDAVTGTLVIANDQVTRANFRVDLTSIKVGGKSQPQFAKSLDTQVHPIATITMTQPVVLSRTFASGSAVSATVTGWLTMHGTSHVVTVTISARRDGPLLQAAGSIPIAFSNWGIERPQGYGSIASLADRGVAEFLIVLRRQ